MATKYFRLSRGARVEASALVIPFTIDAADIQTEIEFDWPSLEFSTIVSATETPRVIPFRIVEPARVDVSANVVPLGVATVPAMLIDADWPSMEFGIAAVIYPEVDLMEFDMPSLEFGADMDSNTGRRASLMIIVKVL